MKNRYKLKKDTKKSRATVPLSCPAGFPLASHTEGEGLIPGGSNAKDYRGICNWQADAAKPMQ